MNINLNRLGKSELAQILGGAFISQSGQINSRKLKDLVCTALDLSDDEYKKNRLFTAQQISTLQAKKILPTQNSNIYLD